LGTGSKTFGNLETPNIGLDFGVNVDEVSNDYVYVPRSVVPQRALEDLVGVYGNGHTGRYTKNTMTCL